MTRLGVLGGTFDPVHLGHLAVGDAVQSAIGLDEVRLVPSRLPPHRRGPHASAYHRFAMAALATQDRPHCTVSDLELGREGPSYSFDTLTAIAAAGLAPSQIFFLIGADAFADIATWSRYPAVLDLAHFVVVARPGTTLEAMATRLPALQPRLTTAAQLGTTAGAGTRIALLDVATPDVSSTAIRARAARGESLAGLVSEPVAQYIRRHGLYGPRW